MTFASITLRPDLFEPLEKNHEEEKEADEHIRADAAGPLPEVKRRKTQF